mgnify:CR=1 FL=1
MRFRYLLLFCLAFQSIVASGDEIASVSLFGHVYQLQLVSNERLLVTGMSARGEGINSYHYRGTVQGQEGSWVRVSLVDGRWQGVLSMGGETYIIDSSATSSTSTDSTTPGLRRADMMAEPVSNFEVAPCGLVHGDGGQEIMASRQRYSMESQAGSGDEGAGGSSPIPQEVAFSSLCATTVNGLCLLAELEVAFDQQFQQVLSDADESPADQALAIINMAEGYYRNDLNIAFDTLTVELLTSTVFTTTQDATELLEDVRLKRQNNELTFEQSSQSLFHLVTGRDFNEGTAGIAYANSMCGAQFGTGVTQLIQDFSGPHIPLTALVMAHEIGHNMGAAHDVDDNSCGSGFIMEATLNIFANSFSSCSQSEIQDYIATIPSPAVCMNFPVDIAISAAGGNPGNVTEGEIFTLEYAVQTSSGFMPVSGIQVSGSVPNGQGTFSSVTLNGLGCTVASDSLSYQCQADNPPANMTLLVNAVAETLVDGADSTYSQQVSLVSGADLTDVNTGNEQAQSVVIVADSASPEPEPETPTASSSGGGGGGSSGGWLLAVLTLLALDRNRRGAKAYV